MCNVRLSSLLTIINKNPICVSFADELVTERGRCKAIAEEMDQTFADLVGY